MSARVLPGFPNTQEQSISRDCLLNDFYCSREFERQCFYCLECFGISGEQ